MKVRQALTQARQLLETERVEDSVLEAELLLRTVLGVTRARLFLDFERELAPELETAYQRLVRRRLAGEPSAYITGRREFYGRDFLVTPDVLIPRPETEMLVEMALALCQEGNTRRIVDVGTGSGAIAVTLAAELPEDVVIYATDVSEAALAVAAGNAARHGVVERVRLLPGDMLRPLPEPVDLLLANLPYVKSAGVAGILKAEPALALDGGADGLEKFYRLCRELGAGLRPAGAALLEVGLGQARPVSRYLNELYPAAATRIHWDPAGIERVVELRRG
ncbi:MAG: peptide chain release factor N(5)-glutamine methyltransferase [Chloroflexi bacterium]|nr:peptide chain release factor N(5)-glutamine methyltransferase [Chloroflexota bacterium]